MKEEQQTHSQKNWRILLTLEARRDLLSTIVKQQAQWGRCVEVNTQCVSFNSLAKAYRWLKVSKSIEEAATR